MEYYNLLNLKKEPFSNSPEPEFLFQSPQYTACLQKLELAVRLRRGLNVVIGDIGTGKTTLCRKLIQSFCSTREDSEKIETHLLLDPSSNSAVDFLRNVAIILNVKDIDGKENEWQLKEKIKDYLFIKGVNENKTVVLIIDEGQKIPENCLEILREFLNYETNDSKLLQIIIFAQEEFKKVIQKRENLTDRINLVYYIQPLNFAQMRAMIRYRISVARNMESGPELFSPGGILAIYLSTRGYPRKVVSLCHQVLLTLIIRGEKKAGFFFVRKCWKEKIAPLQKKKKWAAASLAIIIAVIMIAAALFFAQDTGINFNLQSNVPKIIPEAQQKPIAPVVPAPAITAAPSPAELVIPENKIPEVKMPKTLGTLTAKKGMNLWQTSKNIYGEVNQEIINKVNKANTHIINKNLLKVGENITIPAIPATVKPVGEGSLIVILKNGKDIKSIYNFFYENINNKNMPPTVFLSFWSKKNGLTFAVALDKSFDGIKETQAAISKLPDKNAAEAKIMSSWNEKTVFFNNRVFNRE
jgi:general secretion pathway protein A